jgi:hypothetical protein
MAVIRKIDLNNYAVDANGNVVNDLSRSMKLHFVRKSFPIDNYDIPQSFLASSRVGRMRILKVPLLGQAGYKSNWCGRTSISMAYNWFVLLKGADPRKLYITHWDAGQPSFRMNLRFPDGRRAFTCPEDPKVTEDTKPTDLGDHSPGLFAEIINKDHGKEYKVHHLEPYLYLGNTTPVARAEQAKRAKLASKLTDAEIRLKFDTVIKSIELNNPVFLYSGLTKGCNHLILLVGFAYIREGAGERLWLVVADPAGEEWLTRFDNALDLTTEGASLNDLRANHNVILLINGHWLKRMASLSLVRATFFFQIKASLPLFEQLSKPENYATYSAASSLVLDDVGNPAPGGKIFYCYDSKHATAPEGAVVSRESRCVFPLDLPGIADFPIPALYRQESRPPDLGGFYPLGRFGNLHGGVHYPTRDARGAMSGVVPVRAMAPGRIVAARLSNTIPEALRTAGSSPSKEDQTRAAEMNRLAHELAGNSPDFVLIRHEMKAVAASDRAASKPIVFYCLYMHLAEPVWGAQGGVGSSPYAKVPWLHALIRESMGSLTVVDPEASGAVVGDHFWPAESPIAETSALPKGTFKHLGSSPSEVHTLEIAEKPDHRICLVAKPPEADIIKALKALSSRELVTFPKAHRNLVVETGTIVGWASESSALASGFIHWEILAEADKGVKHLVELAQNNHLNLFVDFKEGEKNTNNLLDIDEEGALNKLLPAEDQGPKMRELSELSFAESADKSAGKLRPNHYHLRLDVRNFEGLVPTGPTPVTLHFSAGGSAATTTDAQAKRGGQPGAPPITIELEAGDVSKLVEVPGWASVVEVSSPGLMAREREGDVKPEDLDAHMARLATRRWRNVVMRHLNEWSDNKMQAVIDARYPGQDKEKTLKLKKLVEALGWWGDAEVPLYSSDLLFGEGKELARDTLIDNIHPVVALWLINALLERSLAVFEAPTVTPHLTESLQASFAGWLPATPERARLRAGAMVSAVAISNSLYDSEFDVEIRAVETNGAATPVSLGKGQYRSDSFRAGAEISGWGKFKLEVLHTKKKDGKVDPQDPVSLGEPIIELLTPVFSEYVEAPVLHASGLWSWDIEFESNCPNSLLGYLIVNARLKSDPAQPGTLRNVAYPVRAIEPALSPTAATYERGYLVAPPKGKHIDDIPIVSGVVWSEVKAAHRPGAPIRVARRLLKALGVLYAVYTERVPRGDFRLLRGTLADNGCEVQISALTTRGKKGTSSNRENNKILLGLARDLGLSVVAWPPDAAAPEHLSVAVSAPPGGDTLGGVLRMEFDTKELFGAVLAEMKPGKDQQVEVFLGCRFYNGGHVMSPSTSNEADPMTGAMERAPAITDVKWNGLGTNWKEVWSKSVNGRLSLPRIEHVQLKLWNRGIWLAADLIGGDEHFWRAARPQFDVNGERRGAVTVSGAGPAARRFLTAHYVIAAPKADVRGKAAPKADVSGTLSIQAETTMSAQWGNVQLGAGVVRWVEPESKYKEYDATPRISDVQVAPHPRWSRLLQVTAKVHAIPPPSALEVCFEHKGENLVAGRHGLVIVKSLIWKSDGVVKPDGEVVATLDIWKLRKAYESDATFDVSIRSKLAAAPPTTWPLKAASPSNEPTSSGPSGLDQEQ